MTSLRGLVFKALSHAYPMSLRGSNTWLINGSWDENCGCGTRKGVGTSKPSKDCARELRRATTQAVLWGTNGGTFADAVGITQHRSG